MNISASDVKNLREMTGAGMLDCKNALEASNGNIDAAVDYLREKGIAKAAKKADRIAAEGLTNIYVDANTAVVIEINSETDFVAKNEEFKALLDKVGNSLLSVEVTTMEEANNVEVDGNTISELIVTATATIGEKLSFRRFERLVKNDSQVFGAYSHMGGKISSLVLLNGGNAEIAKDVAMQAAAMRPLYLNKDEVPASVLEHEKEVLKAQAIEEGKPAEFAEKIIEGRIGKFYEEVCLVDQKFVKDSSGISVAEFLKNNNAEVIKMVRYEVGEGMEKREDNFEEEVRRQLEN